MHNILKLNEISAVANKAFDENYSLSSDCVNPDAIMLRSFNMHDYEIPASVQCVGRAGAGVNNIPCDAYAEKGIVVFNTPGANANAVKELVLGALLVSSRNIYEGIKWAGSLTGKGDVAKLVEKGKGAFVGPELLGKKIGVIGLGAIGARVANACIELGMQVAGYDPYISIDGAWNLNHNVIKEVDIKHIFATCDYITLHVPCLESTKNTINEDAIALMKDGVTIINCSRGELVDNKAIIAGVSSKKVAKYVTDFPCEELLNIENIITIPHLGASTPEAEDNCAFMAATEIVDFLENGNITNSVNFPCVNVARSGKCRITVIHKNVQKVLNSITDIISKESINICNMISQARGNYAYAILDLDEEPKETTITAIAKLDNIVKVRKI